MTKITGDVAVDKMLGRLSDKGLRKVLVSALRKVAQPIVKEVRKQIVTTGSVDTGTFKKSIGVIPSKNKKIAVVYVGSKNKGANEFGFANLLEKGSSAFDVDFQGRKVFEKAYNATRLKGTKDIETIVINLIKKKIK
tara:strand:- start:85 stop:495 length:411 start_codon:yes stop_codon:yes gene_type:complete